MAEGAAPPSAHHAPPPRPRSGPAILLLLALLVLLLTAGGGWLGAAAARQLELRDFQMLAEVERDGSVLVQETLTARFEGSWNGILRQIPVLARRPSGLEPLGLTLLSVTDAQGRPYRTENRPKGNERELRIFIPAAVDSEHTAVLRYRIRNGVRFYRDHDEFNWNVTGNGWQIPIDRVSARVRLPEGVRGLHASLYTGPRGAHGRDGVLSLGRREVTARSTRRLEPGEGLTLAVGFDKGLVAPRSRAEQARLWLQTRLALLLPLGTGLVLGGTWWRCGRDPALGSIPVRYEPPEGMPPALLHTLAKERVEPVCLGATLVDLAVKGHLRIQRSADRLLLPDSYRFTLLTAPQQWQQLARHESFLLETLFTIPTPGSHIDTDALREHYYVHVPAFRRLLRDAVVGEGFHRRWPGTERTTTLVAALVAAGVAVAALLWLLPHDLLLLQLRAQPLLTPLSLIGTFALIGLFAHAMPRRTARGTEVLRRYLGFLEFLGRVEAPRIERMVLTPELFERFLPYAMAAGLTRRWTSAFQGILQEPPRWIEIEADGADFDLDAFGSDLSDWCRSTCRALEAAPSPVESSGSGGGSWGDSSSGSSGGGSSGGGDGGGGGGGF